MRRLTSTSRHTISRSKAPLLALLLSSLALLTGCASTPVATVEPFRAALPDICVSNEDVLTERTAQQIEGTNLALRRMLKRGSQCPKATGKAKPAPVKAPVPADKPEPTTS